jgi:hypothetical protein
MLFKRALTAFLVTITALAFASVTYAYAASNTVPANKAGDGAGAITGYTVTNLQYVLDGTNPQLIATVNFNLSADATTVKIRLVNTGTTWYNCTVTHSSPWPVTCSTSGATVLAADELRVVALDH